MGDGFLAILAIRVSVHDLAEALVPAHMGYNGTFVLLKIAPYQGQVTALYGMVKELFGQVDKTLAAKGRALFAENCAGCHVPRTSQGEGRYVQHLKMLPVDYIGTDPGAANNIAP